MYGGFLYRLNYEEYKKHETEMDEKIEQLSLESEDEEIEPLDEAYIVRVDEDDIAVGDKGYFLLLVGDHHFDADYIEEVLYGQEPSYARYRELQEKESKEMTREELIEAMNLQEEFSPNEAEDVEAMEDIVAEGKTE